MNAFIERITKNAVRRGLRDGLLAGDGKWLALGALAWLVRYLSRKNEPKVLTERLRAGETIVVTNVGPPPRGRRARRAVRDEATRQAARQRADALVEEAVQARSAAGGS